MHRFHAEYHLNRNSGYYFLSFFLLFSLVSRFVQLFIVKLLVACFCKLITFILAKTTESFFSQGLNFMVWTFHGVKCFMAAMTFFTAWKIFTLAMTLSQRETFHSGRDYFHAVFMTWRRNFTHIPIIFFNFTPWSVKFR